MAVPGSQKNLPFESGQQIPTPSTPRLATRIEQFLVRAVLLFGVVAMASILVAICTPSMRPYFLHFLSRWIAASTRAVGTNPLGFLLLLADAVVFLVVTAGD